METRIALVGIVVEDLSVSPKVNDLLHEYGQWIRGRMGLPYPEKGVSIISIVLDAPNQIISALTGKLGSMPGASAKAMYTKEKGKDNV